MTSHRTQALQTELEKLYKDKSTELLFHGWHHIMFVAKKAVEFSSELHVNVELVEAAALTHDLNYVAKPNSEPQDGKELRVRYLKNAGFTETEVEAIDELVMQEHTATRHGDISDGAKALSDADTLFKSLPVTPILLAGHFLTETKTDIGKLANKVVGEQKPLMDQDIYFYTKAARNRYMKWAKTNLQLWQNVQESLADDDVNEMLATARRLNVL